MSKQKWHQRIVFSIVTRKDGRIRHSYDVRWWGVIGILLLGGVLWLI